MGMHAQYRSVSGAAVKALLQNPDLVQVVARAPYTAGDVSSRDGLLRLGKARGYVTYAEINECMPDDVTASHDIDSWLWAITEAGIQIVDEPPAADPNWPPRLVPEARRALGEHGLDEEDVENAVSIDKAFAGLGFLLQQHGVGDVVYGGQEIGDDLGYGPARLLTADRVAELARKLRAIDTAMLRDAYDPTAMARNGVYAGDWEDPAELDWLLGAYEKVREVFSRSAARSHSLLLYVT